MYSSYQVKSKVAAKSGTANYQWQIMQNMGLADKDIKAYVLYIYERGYTDNQCWLGPVHTYADIFENGGFFRPHINAKTEEIW